AALFVAATSARLLNVSVGLGAQAHTVDTTKHLKSNKRCAPQSMNQPGPITFGFRKCSHPRVELFKPRWKPSRARVTRSAIATTAFYLAALRGDFAFLRCLTFSLAALLDEPPFLASFRGDFVFLRCLTFSLAALLDEPPFLASFRGDFAFLRCLTFSLAALLEEPPFLIGFLGGTAMSAADQSTSLTAARFAGRGRLAKSRRSRIWIRFGSK